MFEGTYTLELYKDGKKQILEFKNFITRPMLLQYGFPYIANSSLAIAGKKNGTFLSEKTKRQWQKEPYSSYANKSNYTVQYLTWIDPSVEKNGYREFKVRSSSFFSDVSIYGLGLAAWQTGSIYRTDVFLSILDLPYTIVLGANDYLYIWYSLKMRWS